VEYRLSKLREQSNANTGNHMPLSAGKAYLELLADDPSAQRALLACAAALRLDDETADGAIAIVTENGNRTRELLHEIKNLGCIWRQWDGSWYLAEEVRKELVGELYQRIPKEQILKLRNQLAEKADGRAAAMLPDGQITAHQLRTALIEAGYQRTLVPEQAKKGGEQLGDVWEKGTPAAGESTARSVDYLAPEIEKHMGQLPVQVLFLRGMAARARGDRATQEKYFRVVWEQGRAGYIFGAAAHFFGLLVRDPRTAEQAFRNSVQWNDIPRHKAHAYHSLGNLLARDRGRTHEAEEAYMKSLELDPSAFHAGQVWHSLGNLLVKDRHRLGEAEEAYKTSLRSLNAAQDQAQVWHSLGNLLAKDLHRLPEAEDAYNKSLELWNDTESEAHVGASLANLLSKYRNPQADNRAERLALRSLEIERGNPWTNGVCFRVLADVYERRGDNRRAIEAIKSLIETDRRLGGGKFNQINRDRIAALSSSETKESTFPTPPRPRASRLEDRIQSAIEKVAREAWEAAAVAATDEEAFKIAKQEAMRLIAGVSREVRGRVNHYFTSAKWAPLLERAPAQADTAAPEEESGEDNLDSGLELSDEQ
jgi:tetratricopeptide (TPR) repeat protein